MVKINGLLALVQDSRRFDDQENPNRRRGLAWMNAYFFANLHAQLQDSLISLSGQFASLSGARANLPMTRIEEQPKSSFSLHKLSLFE